MEHNLDSSYWDNLYNTGETKWNIGDVSLPMKGYIDQLKDKSIAILIPGCGNSYEAEYLLEQGFNNITVVDISPVAVKSIESRLAQYLGKGLTVICNDFFKIDQQFDLVLEQTFFCALDPSLRKAYVDKMFDILKPAGKLAGVMFNRDFEESPPFGGSKEEYRNLFSNKFDIRTMEECYNSIERRKGTEVFVIFIK